jgi:hypothetical protein
VLARLCAAVITLAVIFGVVQRHDHRGVTSAVAVEVDDAPDLAPEAVVVESIALLAPVRMHRTIEPPALALPSAVLVASRTFRPPRS